LKLCANPQILIFSLFNYWLKMPNTEKNNPERGKEGDGEMERGGGRDPMRRQQIERFGPLRLRPLFFSPVEL
jgi:hypothetical protein